MGNAIRYGGMKVFHEIDRQAPAKVLSSILGKVISRLDVHGASLFFGLYLSWVDIESIFRFFFGKRASLDGVRTEDAAGQNFLLQTVGHLGKRSTQEPRLRVGNPLQEHSRLMVIHADLKGKRTEPGGFHKRPELTRCHFLSRNVHKNVQLFYFLTHYKYTIIVIYQVGFV
jgi:hypothetical protein